MSNPTLEQLRLKKVLINDIEIIKEHITTIRLFESITQPGITGYIDLMDFQGAVEKGSIFANDKIKIMFTIEGKPDLTLEYTLYSNESGNLLPKNQYSSVRFGLCSPWLVAGLTKKVSKFYENKFIHEIVEDLLKECGATIGKIEPTKQKLENFVTPLWTPYHSIKYLLSFAMNLRGSGGYLCWTDLKTGKVNMSTLNHLMNGSLGKFEEFQVFGTNPRYEGRMTDITIETNYDLIRLINTGALNTKIYGFNYDKKQFQSTDKKINEVKQAHLSSKFPIPKTFLEDKSYTSIKFNPNFPSTNEVIEDESKLQDLIEGKLQNEYAFLSTDVFKINGLSVGEPNRRVGWLAKLDFPSQNINKKGHETEIYKQYKGNYLIRDINHSFSFFQEYQQAICLCADGYKMMNRDAITWK